MPKPNFSSLRDHSNSLLVVILALIIAVYVFKLAIVANDLESERMRGVYHVWTNTYNRPISFDDWILLKQEGVLCP